MPQNFFSLRYSHQHGENATHMEIIVATLTDIELYRLQIQIEHLNVCVYDHYFYDNSKI